MKTIEYYGWNNHFEKYITTNKKNDFEVGRVISIKGFIYTLITNMGETESELSGKLLFGTEPENLPKIGDWVHFTRYGSIGYIIEALPRINELSRRAAGPKAEKQVLAANIDYTVVVQALDRDFNLMRMERYLVQIAACNIKPIIVLNKTDLTDDPDKYRCETEKLGKDIPVYLCSTYNQIGISELRNTAFEKNKTYILVGSSGAGKSSLLNSLTNSVERPVGTISSSTGKGRHTTTSRDLFRLPNGSLVIDNPGMREFGITSEEAWDSCGLFPLIDSLSKYCRYSDCQHLEESGCAVSEAYRNGQLEPKIYESYLKLIKEQKYFELKTSDKKRLGKHFGKMIREVREYRKKYKY